MPLKVGIIGFGKMGKIRKKELDAHEGFKVVAVCDINEKTKEEYPHLFFTSHWNDIIQLDIDAVFICTFNHIIPEIVETALNKGIHVFSEKPPGTCLDDVIRMRNASRKNPEKILKFGFNHRFHYGIIEAKALLDSGRYGNILWARGVYGKAGSLDFEKSWRSDKALAGGGILLDQGIHMLDLLMYMMGDFDKVKSYTQNMYWKNIPFEDNAFALLKTKDDKVAMLHSSATHWKHKFLLEIFLEEGYVIVNGILSGTRSYGEESITFAKKQLEDEATAMGKPREQTIYFDRDDSWKLEVEEFYNCIKNPGKAVTGNIDEAYKVMTLVQSIYQASTANTEIQIGEY